MSRAFKLPSDAETVALTEHPDGVHVDIEVFNEENDLIESHLYARRERTQ